MLVDIVGWDDAKVRWYDQEVLLWVCICLLDGVAEFKNFVWFDGFLFALLDWNYGKNYRFQSRIRCPFWKRPIVKVCRWKWLGMCRRCNHRFWSLIWRVLQGGSFLLWWISWCWQAWQIGFGRNRQFCWRSHRSRLQCKGTSTCRFWVILRCRRSTTWCDRFNGKSIGIDYCLETWQGGRD